MQGAEEEPQERDHDAAAYRASQSEQIVLGGMMGSSDAVWAIHQLLRPDDFSEPKHEVLARTIIGLAQDGKPTDPVAVADELDRLGVARQAGGQAYLFGLETWPPTGLVEHHASLIAAEARRRRMRQAGEHIVKLADASGDPDVLMEQAMVALEGASPERAGADGLLGEEWAAALDRAEQGRSAYLRTPWLDLDAYLTGWHPGRMYVVGARPASGKSILGLQAAVGLAASGTVLFSSLEMSRGDLMSRLIAQRAGVDLTSWERGALTAQEWERVAKIRAWTQRLPLHVDARPDQSVAQIVAKARTVARRTGNLRAVVVDYLGLIRTPADRRGRWEHVGDISRSLKLLAQKLDVPVIALAQLNRGSVEGGKQRDPNLADLRESGSIEQDADVVLLLQRRLTAEGGDSGILDVIVGKNRHGRVGKFGLTFDGAHARLLNMRDATEAERDTKVRLDIDG